MHPLSRLGCETASLRTAVVCKNAFWSAFLPGRRKAMMAGKDKGGRASKTPPAKTAKEKRKSKNEKKAGKGTIPT